MQETSGTPLLGQLTPYHGFEPSHQRYVPLSRFHGSQRLNLMRATRLPANSRRYTAGDPIHLIDWRAFARNEQLIVREQNDEASCRVMLLVEDSPTLSWPDKPLLEKLARPVCTKRELVLRITFHLAYQCLRWGDRVKVYRLRENRAESLNLRSQTDAAILFDKVLKSDFSEKSWETHETRSLEYIREERCDLMFWVSDGFSGIPDWLLQKKGPYACWLQVLSSLEIDPSWLKPEDCYFDESGTSREYTGSALLQQQNLLRALERWQEEAQRSWLRSHRHHLLVHDETPIRSFLSSLEQPWGLLNFGRGGAVP